jgi:hypothetical protein
MGEEAFAKYSPCSLKKQKICPDIQKTVDMESMVWEKEEMRKMVRIMNILWKRLGMLDPWFPDAISLDSEYAVYSNIRSS